MHLLDANGKCVWKSHIDNWDWLPLDDDTSNAYKLKRECLKRCKNENSAMAALMRGDECQCSNQESAER